ncbi:hypothetical protein [Streptomyces sp. NPDC002521]
MKVITLALIALTLAGGAVIATQATKPIAQPVTRSGLVERPADVVKRVEDLPPRW